jgi:hypothetical protein
VQRVQIVHNTRIEKEGDTFLATCQNEFPESPRGLYFLGHLSIYQIYPRFLTMRALQRVLGA